MPARPCLALRLTPPAGSAVATLDTRQHTTFSPAQAQAQAAFGARASSLDPRTSCTRPIAVSWARASFFFVMACWRFVRISLSSDSVSFCGCASAKYLCQKLRGVERVGCARARAATRRASQSRPATVAQASKGGSTVG